MKKVLSLLIMAIFALSAMAKDIQTVVVTTTPQMHCENCENRIKNNLRFEKGVKKIETNIEQQTVTITYDADKTTVEQLLKGFEKFKYSARVLKDGETVEAEEHEGCENM
ncbi:MAG: cation transporter [Muribaculaceae bacterium]|nr:cation transporter [Muribaculaceae bacterium]